VERQVPRQVKSVGGELEMVSWWLGMQVVRLEIESSASDSSVK
jgi:hypothetical protein